MAAIITEKFKQHNANQFYESFSESANNTYYLFLGKAVPFTSGTSGGTDAAPPTPSDSPADEYYIWDDMLAAKKIGTTDITYAIPRRNWANSTIYDQYEDNIGALGWEIESSILAKLDQLVPPGEHTGYGFNDPQNPVRGRPSR